MATDDDNNNSSSIIMANDDNTNNSSSIIMATDDDDNNNDSSSIITVYSEYPCPKGGIEYVRVNKIDGDEEGRLLIFGSVIVTDCLGNYIAYHRPGVRPDSKAPGDYLSLSGPVEGIIADSGCGFSISVNLWVKLGDRNKQIAQGEIYWNPITTDGESMGKPLEQVVGSVTVGFSIIDKAFNATINNVMMTNKLPAQIYGTIKAFRFLSSGVSYPMPWMLFDKSANECVLVNPGQSIPLTRPFFPVPAGSHLTIAVDLWNHASDQIALGSVQVTPKYGRNALGIVQSCTNTMNITGGKYGDVQVSISFN